jgi:hypothetical protein
MTGILRGKAGIAIGKQILNFKGTGFTGLFKLCFLLVSLDSIVKLFLHMRYPE